MLGFNAIIQKLVAKVNYLLQWMNARNLFKMPFVYVTRLSPFFS
ncbi:hypothetical protein SLEP1_g27346 [Rubroshorea leprosula]|uniref:Uncharacterized protein n=1 Tax=Rubroshorea leprosula TaxID=152421 RepID=A0AAV5JSW1_9ROSI|nr:hypothetical protein SLEP1_g27346 [Rubroshorea leprosula]